MKTPITIIIFILVAQILGYTVRWKSSTKQIDSQSRSTVIYPADDIHLFVSQPKPAIPEQAGIDVHRLYDGRQYEGFDERYNRSPKIALYMPIDIIDWQLDRIQDDQSIAAQGSRFALQNTRAWILRNYEMGMGADRNPR